MRNEKSKRVPSKLKIGATTLLALGLILSGCGKKESEETGTQGKAQEKPAAATAPSGPDKGIGPIQSVEIGSLDMALVAKGEKLFSGTCSACHKLDQRYVGPALAGVTKRRTPEWIMNMVLNPTGMTANDSIAKDLLGTYMTQMSVIATQEDARAVLEYFRSKDGI